MTPGWRAWTHVGASPGCWLSSWPLRLVRTLPGVLLAAVPALVLALLARLEPRWVGERLGTLLLVLIPLTLPLPFLLVDPVPWWSWGPLTFSHRGLIAALVLLIRASVLVALTLVLLATASLETLLKASHALGVPGVLTHIALLTFRYLFVVADELARLRRALRVRGFRNRADRHSYHTVGQVAGTLLGARRGSCRTCAPGDALPWLRWHFPDLDDVPDKADGYSGFSDSGGDGRPSRLVRSCPDLSLPLTFAI